MTFYRFSLLLSRLFFVPKCVACGERLPPMHPNGVLCDACREMYDNEKEASCPVCAARLSDCLCVPQDLPRTRVRKMAKLTRYRPSSEDVSAKIVYALKHRRLIDLQRFVASEFVPALYPLVGNRKEWAVSFPPRSAASLRRDGFDHAALVARSLAEALQISYAPCLVHEKQRVAQKKLSRTARLAAAKEGYGLRKGADVLGKRVILFDDVCTSGATMTACARLLYKAGAKEVVFAAFAITPSKYASRF
ncbi:MAG: ComF family protein [Clostridia bacterium]|nr:ComF family protein [Clostridia bacterium]